MTLCSDTLGLEDHGVTLPTVKAHQCVCPNDLLKVVLMRLVKTGFNVISDCSHYNRAIKLQSGFTEERKSVFGWQSERGFDAAPLWLLIFEAPVRLGWDKWVLQSETANLLTMTVI